MNDCHDVPNQNINIISPPKVTNSFEVKSSGKTRKRCVDEPNNAFIQLRTKNVGASRYNSTRNTKQRNGYKSKKKLKKSISATNIRDPGNPKNIKRLTRLIKKSLGHKKLTPLSSVIKRVLNLLPIASTSRNELVESKAWLISIQKLANIKDDWPLITHIVNQCISTTVE